MHRLISISLITVFTLWLLPLGIFIAPAKEKLLCDGQRAVCMCSHAPSMGKKEDSGKTVVKADAPVLKESSSSAGHYYLTFKQINLKNIRAIAYFSTYKSFYNLLVCKPVEHVPKA